jgi:hypothetical protein
MVLVLLGLRVWSWLLAWTAQRHSNARHLSRRWPYTVPDPARSTWVTGQLLFVERSDDGIQLDLLLPAVDGTTPHLVQLPITVWGTTQHPRSAVALHRRLHRWALHGGVVDTALEASRGSTYLHLHVDHDQVTLRLAAHR